uniref:N-acetylmuramoyl-L-alanine amidase n=1 Tax=Bacillus sp. REN10 TaxID=2782541 RepID=UPI00193AFEF4
MSKVVVIDFGHGLPDPGAVKYGQEYQYAALIGKEVEKRLPTSIKVIHTRTSDKALSNDKGADLNRRCDIANKNKADLFISIHLNAGGGTGYETLVYSPCKEGDTVHTEVAKILRKHGIKDRGIKSRKDVRVLNGTQMPALLLECLFIDNKADMDKLNNQSFFK